MENDKKIIIIPAKNEEKNLSKLINSLPNYIDYLILNDYSKDNTVQILKNYKSKYLSLEDFGKKTGYDNAINLGLEYAKKNKYDYCIIIDADGQHPINKIDIFFNELKSNQIVVGNRNIKRLSEKIFGLTTNFIFKVKDPLCGMKAYRINIFEKIKFDDSYNIGTSYILNKSIKNIKNINITVKKTTRKSKFGNSLVANIKIFYVLLKTIIKMIFKS